MCDQKVAVFAIESSEKALTLQKCTTMVATKNKNHFQS